MFTSGQTLILVNWHDRGHGQAVAVVVAVTVATSVAVAVVVVVAEPLPRLWQSLMR